MTEKMDRRYWTTRDGHEFTSVPTDVPKRWTPAEGLSRLDEPTRLFYMSGEYKIARVPYGRTFTYEVYRDNVVLPLASYSRLADAKDRAVKNARGDDTINVA